MHILCINSLFERVVTRLGSKHYNLKGKKSAVVSYPGSIVSISNSVQLNIKKKKKHYKASRSNDFEIQGKTRKYLSVHRTQQNYLTVC